MTTPRTRNARTEAGAKRHTEVICIHAICQERFGENLARGNRLGVAATNSVRSNYLRSNRSAATNRKNTTEITPFMVKNAAFSLLRSS
jgi:hypothetical protein